MENSIQVYIVANDGFVFDMDKITEAQAKKLTAWTFGKSDEIRGFKMMKRGGEKQIILRIPYNEYNNRTFQFFDSLWKENNK